MAAIENETRDPLLLPDSKRIREVLDRGEIIRLLAEIESGRISPHDLEVVLEEREKSHWYRQVLRAVLGR